jgi:hypothetical protein
MYLFTYNAIENSDMYVLCGELYNNIIFEDSINVHTLSILALLHALSTNYHIST